MSKITAFSVLASRRRPRGQGRSSCFSFRTASHRLAAFGSVPGAWKDVFAEALTEITARFEKGDK